MRALRVMVVAIGTVVVCATGSAVGASAPPAAKGPAITVTPSTGLHNGESVQVKGARFRAKDHVYLVECLVGAAGQNQCDLSTVTPATITTTGKLPTTKFKVVTGKVGSGSCGTKASNLSHCDISVGNASGGDAATARIKFAHPK
jgi:neocarzinostatin family protein